MKIQNLNKFKAILPFGPTELPRLTIVTGLNGSGKSQLLAGLHSKTIQNDLLGSVPTSDDATYSILLQNWDPVDQVFQNNRSSRFQQQITTSPIQRGRKNSFDFVFERSNRLQNHLTRLGEAVGTEFAGIANEQEDIWHLGVKEIKQRAGISESNSRADLIREVFQDAEKALCEPKNIQDTRGNLFSRTLKTASNDFQISALQVKEWMTDAILVRNTTEILSPDIPEIFGRYIDQQLTNEFDEVHARRNPSRTYFQPEEFISRFGAPPWEAFSELISAMDLPFQIEPPSPEPSAPVELKLRRASDGASLRFTDLSSGEKVLLRFAISLMRPNPNLIGYRKPSLLLLDEMDASLHPEMVQRWLRSIERGLIEKLGMHVVITTHSPTTVALAPEDSIFAMVDGRPEKVSKQAAINRLTFGVPTLAIDYSGRRQVFCESDTDAAIFGKVFSKIKQSLSLAKQLSFIGTGIRDKSKIVETAPGVEMNAGEAVVRKIVSDLAKLNVNSVFGLIDWDGKAKPDKRVFVIGQNTYYTIENILLDPFLIGSLIVLEKITFPDLEVSRRHFEALNESARQAIADSVQSKLTLLEDDGSIMDIQYIGGSRIRMKSRYATINGHALEKLLSVSIPTLRKYTTNRGALAHRIAEIVISEYPEFCPAIIGSAFEHISNAQIAED